MSEEKKVEQDQRGAFDLKEFESAMWALVNMAREWEKAYSNSALLYEELDAYKNNVERELRHLVNGYRSLQEEKSGLLRNLQSCADQLAQARAASTSANVAQGAEAIYQVRRNKDEEKMWSDAYEATHYACSQRPEFYETRIVYTAPPAQTATTDDARDAARWRWFTQNYGALNLHEKFAGNTPRVFTHGLKGRSWGEITRTIDAALTATQSGDKS